MTASGFGGTTGAGEPEATLSVAAFAVSTFVAALCAPLLLLNVLADRASEALPDDAPGLALLMVLSPMLATLGVPAAGLGLWYLLRRRRGRLHAAGAVSLGVSTVALSLALSPLAWSVFAQLLADLSSSGRPVGAWQYAN
jgi:hypothetical protein